MTGVVAIVPAVVAAGAALMSAWKTFTKARTRHDLSNAIRGNASDMNHIRNQLDSENLDAATAVLRKYVSALPPAEQREAEAALAQPSSTGRAGYLRELVGQSEKDRVHPGETGGDVEASEDLDEQSEDHARSAETER